MKTSANLIALICLSLGLNPFVHAQVDNKDSTIKIDAFIADAKQDLPDENRDFIWQDIYRKQKTVYFIYQNTNADIRWEEKDLNKIKQQHAISLCSNLDNREFLEQGYTYLFKTEFKKDKPMQISIDKNDCMAF